MAKVKELDGNPKDEKKVADTIEARQTKITMIATKGHPYIKTGTKFEVHPIHEAGLRAKGWAVGADENHRNVKDEDIAKPVTYDTPANGATEDMK